VGGLLRPVHAETHLPEFQMCVDIRLVPFELVQYSRLVPKLSPVESTFD
jgi:hypothetical protein